MLWFWTIARHRREPNFPGEQASDINWAVRPSPLPLIGGGVREAPNSQTYPACAIKDQWRPLLPLPGMLSWLVRLYFPNAPVQSAPKQSV